MELVVREELKEGDDHQALTLRSYDSDALLAHRQARALNVTQHLYFLLKSKQWSEFRATLGSYVQLVEGGKDTVILQVPLEVPTRTKVVSLERRLSDAPDTLVLPGDPKEPELVDKPYEGVTVAVKLQKVVKNSAGDDELYKEATYFEAGTMAVRQGICAHFPLMMAHIVYDTKDEGRWHALVNEWADGDLGHLYENHRDDPRAIHHFHRQATLQAMMGLFVMNYLWDVYHNDLHPKNVLFVYLPTPTTFVYDLPFVTDETSDETKIKRLILHNAQVLCLIWDFSKVDEEAELGSNDFYEFFSQAADVYPALTSEVKRLSGYTPAETKDVYPWIDGLMEGWAAIDPAIIVETLTKEEVSAKLLPHPCVYSSMTSTTL